MKQRINRHTFGAVGCTVGALGADVGYNAGGSAWLLAVVGLLGLAAIWEAVKATQ
jgi:hypothetical protein